MKNTILFKTIIYLLVCTTLLSCETSNKKKNDNVLINIPHKEDVGASKLTDNILKVKAPFPIGHFEKPIFPQDTLIPKLENPGMNTVAIQSTIDELSSSGGGTILIPEGSWLTGRIELKSNVNFHLSSNSILRFSGEIEDYQPAVFTRIEGIEVMSLGACIYANNAKNIAITGSGKLIGPATGSVREKIFTKDVIENIIDQEAPVSSRIVDGIKTPYIFPPMFISPINSQKVFIEGISLENTAFWNIVPIYCENVIIRGVTVNSVGIPRGDGIDIDSSKDVLIEYCTLSCGDDAFTIKSGRDIDGITVNKPTENVVIRNCLVKKAHGGITCGSETAGMIKNVYVHDCVLLDAGKALRFKSRRPRGGGGENLIYERIRANLTGNAIDFDLLGSPTFVGELANRLPEREITNLTPKYSDITISDILIENSNFFVKAIGIPESPIAHLNVSNAEVTCSQLFDIRDMKEGIFKNINLKSKQKKIAILDGEDISFQNITVVGLKDSVQVVQKGLRTKIKILDISEK